MRAYVTTDGCRMAFLTGLLDDPATGPCGRCANDVGQGDGPRRSTRSGRPGRDRLPAPRACAPIEPRKRWVEGAAGVGARAAGRGSTVIAEPNEPGHRAVRGRRRGLGPRVVRARGGVGRFPTASSCAATRAIRDQWRPEPPPEWVTSIPSRTAGALLDRLRRGARGRARAAVRRECLAAASDAPAAGGDAEQRPPARERAGHASRRRGRRSAGRRCCSSTTSWTAAGR